MTDQYEYDLKIENDYKRVIFPASEAYLRQLEQDILENGCKEPIYVWRKTIIDGHKRYDICKRNQIPFKTERGHFKNRNEAILWICAKEVMKPEITEEMRNYLIGKQFEIRKVYAAPKTIKSSSGESRVKYHKSPYSLTSVETKELLANEYKISTTTVLKYYQYTMAIDLLWEIVPALVEKQLNGEIKISQDNIMRFSKLNQKDKLRLKEMADKDLKVFADPNELDKLFPKNSENFEPLTLMATVKDTPIYDPDVAISSLALTVPSWVNSINRTRNDNNLQKISENARDKLEKELLILRTVVDSMLSVLKEDIHE